MQAHVYVKVRERGVCQSESGSLGPSECHCDREGFVEGDAARQSSLSLKMDMLVFFFHQSASFRLLDAMG